MIEKLDLEKEKALQLYIQLRDSKFGKTKKAKYIEIANRLGKSVHTIETWIRKYLKPYEKYLQELKEDKTLKILNFEGLTEKRSKYVAFRTFGYSKKDAMKAAGFSPNTKAADIEKDPRVKNIMSDLRDQLRDDVRLGASAVINKLADIADKAENGVEYIETEYHDESNPDGRKVYKNIKKKTVFSFPAATTAWTNIAKILGYDATLEVKQTPSDLEIIQTKLTKLKKEKLEKELKEEEQIKVLK